MKTKLLLLMAFILPGALLSAQVNARLFRYPDVSKDKIAFSYGGDIWIVNKTGGTAQKISSPAGEEMFPKFSPDGSKIGYTANYDGNNDIYVLPSEGGIPERITYHGGNDLMVDWNPAGDRIMFMTGRSSGRSRFNQLHTIPATGGLAEKMPMAYSEFGSYSPDGKQIAYTYRSRLFRTWKRYRGGMQPDIFIFNLEDYSSRNITLSDANDELPMWYSQNNIYYLSDRGPEKRYNLWVYDIAQDASTQLTEFKEVDVHFPSMGPDDIVFEAGGNLYLYTIADKSYKEVPVQVVSDFASITPVHKSVEDYIQHAGISPDGKRALIEARGEIFTLPAEDGYVKNLTNSSGVFERYPSWSPDGEWIAYWSDRSGENELMLYELESGNETKVTSYATGYRYNLYWSPDSKKIAFVDQSMVIRLFDTETKETREVDKGLFLYQGGLESFHVSWTSDSRYMTYSRSLEKYNQAVFIYDTESGERKQITSGFYSDYNPVFDPEGKYLYLMTDRELHPLYGRFDYSFIYANASRIAAIPLRAEVESPLAPENDEVTVKKEDKGDKKEGKDDAKKKEKKGKKEENGEENEEEVKTVAIEFDGMEDRLVLLPPDAGNYGMLSAVEGKVLYMKLPNTGAEGEKRELKYYDLKEREEKTIIEGINSYELSFDGKKALVGTRKSAAIIEVKPGQKMEKPLPLSDMTMVVVPREEWKEIFHDAWRLYRDFFYDPNMHGVDWNSLRNQYGELVKDAVTRNDLNFILGELIGELNSSHTYRGGGDNEKTKRLNVGYLGVDWSADQGYYSIKKIIRGADWDAEVRSPLDQPGLNVKEGDYVFAVNGIPLNTDKEPSAAFQGLGDKTVELLVGSSPDKSGAKKIIVKLMSDENRLRHLNWIETKRQRVEEATGGKIGYIYVRSTGIDGQNELVRQYAGQLQKEGLIIDERFNSGGQIPERFIEILNRQPLAFWAVRDGATWQTPRFGNFGPKIMLINGWSGSGGDAFPDYFRKAGIGPLLGTRTWGGLIGMSGVPSLIDGGIVTVPTFRMYNPDGTWFAEGHGVDPDIRVPEDPTSLAKGIDTQLEEAIKWITNELNKPEYKRPGHQPVENRNN